MGTRYHLFQRKYRSKDGRESNLWWYWYWEQGKRIRKPAGENSTAPRLKRDAQVFLDRLIEADAAGPKPTPIALAILRPLPSYDAPRTFKEFAKTLYQEDSQHLKRRALTDGSTIKEETRKAHRGRLDIYLNPRWGACSWAVFEADDFPDMFTDWLVDLERTPTHKPESPAPAPRAISNSTRNAIIETMTIALREAKRSRLIHYVPKLERFTRQSQHQNTLTDDELAKLFPVDQSELMKIWQLKDPRDLSTGTLFGAMCCLGISAGLRSGELRAVSADQIIRHKLPSGDMLNGLIVDKAMDANQEITGLKKATRDDSRARVVVLSDKTMQILDDYLATVPKRDGLLFLYRDHPIRKELLESRWEAGLKQAKINLEGRRLTPHSMRYTYNTRMRMLVSEQTLQEMVGHQSAEMSTLYDRPYLEERLLQLADQRGAIGKFWDTRIND